MKYLRKELRFYQTKCERLELAVMTSKPGAPANYVERTEEVRRPPIGATEITDRNIPKSRFAELQKKWNELSAEEQEIALLDGNWTPDGPAPSTKKATKH